MTKAIADNVPALAATSKALAGLTPKLMAEDVGVPFHPGAARFYKEAGIAVTAK
ncbi:TAXI family TRAP transporter solute-binding subunit [Bosea sp. (in: a-proteobacteria)]|uniref:TAXI family TRAP transporter solute-binding subunit n=1 Tax=Bosea sp. (in: a-proteobacteria) TaxID=1871050 RepID=UPI002FCA223F